MEDKPILTEELNAGDYHGKCSACGAVGLFIKKDKYYDGTEVITCECGHEVVF